MSTQLLIYENVVPLSREKHAQWSVEVGKDFRYSSNINSVPLLTAEFVRAVREYPVVFGQTEDTLQPVIILGMHGEKNFYLNESGEWTAQYIPAFLRRYPFVFARSQDGKTFTLCIDESFGGFNQEDKGERLLTEEGEASPYVDNVLKFLQGYQNEHARTQEFCRKLDEFDLLEPQTAVWNGPNGEKSTLTGFSCVSRNKLKALPPKVLAGMIGAGEMDLIYAHLYSLNNFSNFKDKLVTENETA
ncbi:MAG: SapC family protein [Vulcanimicrobiota bacterium]